MPVISESVQLELYISTRYNMEASQVVIVFIGSYICLICIFFQVHLSEYILCLCVEMLCQHLVPRFGTKHERKKREEGSEGRGGGGGNG